jgi:uroporphyrinogen decarboxylase
MAMTPRERFVRTLTFGAPDRVYYEFGLPRRATMEAWYLQGLPRMSAAGDYSYPPELRAFVGMDPSFWQAVVPVNLGIYPAFEERILEETGRGRVWSDANGITMLDAGAHLNTPGFRTRSYVAHPVRTRADWLQMRPRFDPSTLVRYPENWDAQAAALRQRDDPIMMTVNSLFWKARDWVGFEDLCRMLYDDPRLVHDMMEHVTEFIMEVLERALRDVGLDAVMLNEDMSYKTASMISPAMFREFMLPRYKRLVAFFKRHNVSVVLVDSDGCVAQLIPLWLEAGIDATFPIEAAAANDVIAYRQKYGKRLGFFGCIDKREIRSRERTFIEVMRKVPWLIEQGGYLPSIDHAVPPDVPLRSYLYMCELIKALAEVRPVPGPEARLEIEDRLGSIQRMWDPSMESDAQEH